MALKGRYAGYKGDFSVKKNRGALIISHDNEYLMDDDIFDMIAGYDKEISFPGISFIDYIDTHHYFNRHPEMKKYTEPERIKIAEFARIIEYMGSNDVYDITKAWNLLKDEIEVTEEEFRKELDEFITDILSGVISLNIDVCIQDFAGETGFYERYPEYAG